MAISKFLDPKNEIAFKKVFGCEKNKDIVIHFINDILEFQGDKQIQDLEFLPTVQDPEIASKKQSIVDVLCKTKNGVQIIVEMHVAPTKGFEKRAQYYAAKAYCGQLNKGANAKYHDLKEVIFIAIADCVIFPDKQDCKSNHLILDTKTYERNLEAFSFSFVELPKFTKNNIEDLETIFDKWCYFFKYAPETTDEDLQKFLSEPIIAKAYAALNQFNWTEQELFAYEEEVKRIRDNTAAIDYQLDSYYNKGKTEGKAEGIAEEKVRIALNLLRQNLPLELISSATGLSLEHLAKLKNGL